MSSEDLQWGSPGPCPSCGVVTNHIWFSKIKGGVPDPLTRQWTEHPMWGAQGTLLVSKCAAEDCKAFALWFERHNVGERDVLLVYPQTGIRIPTEDGLEDDETKLYEEAAAIERLSPRAARALLRALLEAFLKRTLVTAGHSVKDKNLAGLIESAVGHLDLSPTLKMGLTAIRKQGNTAVHDPYGLTDDASAEELRWLFQAVDELVEELHFKPQKWADLAGSGSSAAP